MPVLTTAMIFDVTVLIVESDERCRVALVTALRRLGMRALGVVVPDQAVELLDGIDADVALVRGSDDHPAVERLRRKTPLVVVADPNGSIDQAVADLLQAIGRPEAAAHLN
jgi:cobalamin biosynthesis protein CobT